MSVRSVRNEIRRAMQLAVPKADKELTRSEAIGIMNEVERGGVTEGELNEIQKLLEHGVDPDSFFSPREPALRGDDFFLPRPAAWVLEGIITRHGGTVRRPPFIILE